MKEATEKINLENSILDKMKKKIKLTFVKPEVLKKKRNNIISLIRVFPVEDTYETYTEQYVEEVIEKEEEILPVNEENIKDEDLNNVENNENQIKEEKENENENENKEENKEDEAEKEKVKEKEKKEEIKEEESKLINNFFFS